MLSTSPLGVLILILDLNHQMMAPISRLPFPTHFATIPSVLDRQGPKAKLGASPELCRETRIEGKRIEYQCLRSEILHSDRICFSILAFLMTATLTCYGIVAEFGVPELLVLLSVLWTLGYYYLWEKRFAVAKMTFYLKTEVEKEEIGLCWETWLAKYRSKLDRMFVRYRPYYIDTFFSIVVVAINTVLLFWVFWACRTTSAMIRSLLYFVASLASLGIVAHTAVRALRRYGAARAADKPLSEP